MKKNSFKSNIGWVSIVQIIAFVLSFIMSILNARLLGPAGVGAFALLRLMQSLGVSLSDFGFTRSLRYYSANGEISYYDLKKIVFILGAIVGTGLIIISMILKYLPINIWNDIDIEVYLLFLPSMFFYCFSMYLRHLFHGQLLIKTVNISNLLERVFYILLFILFVWYLDWGLIGVSLALSIGSIFLFVQLLIKFQSYHPDKQVTNRFTSKKQILKKLWGYGQWSYYASFLEYILTNFPILYLKSAIGSFELVGYFNKAKGLAEYPKRPALPLSGLLFSYNAGSSERTAANRTETLCRLTFWAISILFWTLALFIKPIISLLYGEAFLPAADIFYILYPSVVLSMQGIYLDSAIAARGYNKETFIIRLKSLPFIIIISYLLINYLGITGAAIALSVSATILWAQYLIKYLSITGSRVSGILLLKRDDFQLLKNIWIKVKQKKKCGRRRSSPICQDLRNNYK